MYSKVSYFSVRLPNCTGCWILYPHRGEKLKRVKWQPKHTIHKMWRWCSFIINCHSFQLHFKNTIFSIRYHLFINCRILQVCNLQCSTRITVKVEKGREKWTEKNKGWTQLDNQSLATDHRVNMTNHTSWWHHCALVSLGGHPPPKTNHWLQAKHRPKVPA